MTDISWTKGDSNDMLLTITDPDTGEPTNLTGGKVWLYAKRNVDDLDANAVVRLDSDGNGIAISDPATEGQALAVLPLDALDAVAHLTWLYWAAKVRVVVPAVRAWTVDGGKVVVVDGVVDATT